MNCKIIQQSNIFYELNKTDLTCEVINSPNAIGNIYFPSSINHESNDYKIIGMKDETFKHNKKVKSVEISDDSFFQTISKKSFSKSYIKNLYISKTVSKLEDGWCINTPKLKKVTLSPFNQNFKYLDEEQKIIVGKSDTNEDTFDTIFFASRDIKEAKIPNSIKYIKPYAFENCSKLKTIEISDDSNLFSIGKKAFSYVPIENIFIPKSVEVLEDGWCYFSSDVKKVTISPFNKNFKYLDEEQKIIVSKSNPNEDVFDTIIFANRDIKCIKIPNHIKYIKSYAFENCEQLKTIEISDDSNLISICKGAFSYATIENIFIPKSVEVLEDGWCFFLSEFKKVTISPFNKNFKYLDEEQKIIVGKSNPNEDVFDTIIFANRDIKQAIIPKSIKFIHSCAFEDCQEMRTIEFAKDSELLSIGENAFSGSYLETILIPKSVKKISKFAFYFCEKLHKFSLEDGSKLESFEHSLFNNCSKLSIIEIPENSSLKTILRSAFSFIMIENLFIPEKFEKFEDKWCKNANNLKNVIISPLNKNFKYLDEYQIIVGKSNLNEDIFDTIIFANRDINQAKIPNYIKYIKPYAFNKCKNLQSFECQNDSKLTYFDKNIFYELKIENIIIPDSVEMLVDCWCSNTSNLKKVIISPSNKNYKYLDEKHQIIVGKSSQNEEKFDTIVFANRDINQVTIPNYIKYIKPYAFEYSNIQTIEFENISELSFIGERAFSSSNLKEITIPKSVKKIQSFAFIFSRKLKSVIFEDGSQLTSIKDGVFGECEKLKKIEIPKNSAIKSIGLDPFSCTKIKNFFISSNVEMIHSYWCNNARDLEKVTISPLNKNFKYLDEKDQIIVGKSNKNEEIFDTIIFVNRDIIDVKLPSSIKYIYPNALSKCKKLINFEIPDDSKLVSFPENSFYLSLIESLYIPANMEILENDWSNVAELIKITISPLNKNFKYLDDEHKIIIGKSNINEDIYDSIIIASRDIEHATIPNYIKYIKSYAFNKCKNLKEITFAKDSKLVSISHDSFSYSALEEITIPKSVIEIKSGAFFCCEDLQKVTFEEGSKLKSLKDILFFSCKELKTIDIPDSITLICDSTFHFSGIEKLFIPKNVEEIEDGWCNYSNIERVEVSPLNKNFKYLDNQHKIIIGKSNMNEDIFDKIIFANRDIEHAYIPKSIKIIDSGAFENCKKLKTIQIPDDSEIDSIGSNAFSSTSLMNFKVPRKINKYSNDFLDESTNICLFEFLGDYFLDNEKSSILSNLGNLILASFPNVKKLSISIKNVSSQTGFTLFVSSGAEVDFPFLNKEQDKNSDDDDSSSE